MSTSLRSTATPADAADVPVAFLRSMPTTLVTEDGETGTSRSWSTIETVSFDEAFKRELCEFHACILENRAPRTPALDGLRDIALASAIVRCHVEKRAVASPPFLKRLLGSTRSKR
jgi:hypothetical protein